MSINNKPEQRRKVRRHGLSDQEILARREHWLTDEEILARREHSKWLKLAAKQRAVTTGN
jgi:hypothetical protein